MDKKIPTADTLFKKLAKDCLEYNILHIDNKQDVMIKRFKEIAQKLAGEKKILRVFDMKGNTGNGNLNFDTVAKSIIGSIKEHLDKTRQYLMNPRGKKDSCIKF